jgi:hypothetical protein
MINSDQSSGSSPPNRPKVQKRDRERLRKLDRKLQYLQDCIKFSEYCKLPSERYIISFNKFDSQRKNLRNRMKGYANKTKS